MNITVFGATGNVGSRVVAEAVARGHQVTAVLRDPHRPHPFPATVRIATGDARDPEDVRRLAADQDLLITATARPPGGRTNWPSPPRVCSPDWSAPAPDCWSSAAPEASPCPATTASPSPTPRTSPPHCCPSPTPAASSSPSTSPRPRSTGPTSAPPPCSRRASAPDSSGSAATNSSSTPTAPRPSPWRTSPSPSSTRPSGPPTAAPASPPATECRPPACFPPPSPPETPHHRHGGVFRAERHDGTSTGRQGSHSAENGAVPGNRVGVVQAPPERWVHT